MIDWLIKRFYIFLVIIQSSRPLTIRMSYFPFVVLWTERGDITLFFYLPFWGFVWEIPLRIHCLRDIVGSSFSLKPRRKRQPEHQRVWGKKVAVLVISQRGKDALRVNFILQWMQYSPLSEISWLGEFLIDTTGSW